MPRAFCVGTIVILIFSQMASAVPQRVPEKFGDSKLRQRVETRSYFSKEKIASGEFVRLKSQEWQACRQTAEPSELVEPRQSKLDLKAFIENDQLINRLDDMQRLGLLEGQVERQPWSGDYWAFSRGILGARTFDPAFDLLTNWLERFQFIEANSAASLLSGQGVKALNRLSPSEKYDLLVGDEQGGLTEYQWAEGKWYYDVFGEVEDWMGICHGWAAAAMMEPRPARQIELRAATGNWRIPWKPSEIKGLVSYNWAYNPFPVTFLGQRCNKIDPERDANGRLIDPECFDLNPAIWHQAVVNRLGIHRQSFVIDVTYDYEVWNQPILAYLYAHFNPISRELVDDASAASVKPAEYTNDPFAKYRSSSVSKIVGISMVIGYMVETMADDAQEDSEERDAVNWVNYFYDLELNEKNEIIGGEWYGEMHPDFVWTPLKDSRPRSPLEQTLEQTAWKQGDHAIPESWSQAAKRLSREGLVPDTLTRAILKKSTAL